MALTRFEELLAQMEALSAAKGKDYAGTADSYANFRVCEKIGIPAHIGVMVRMGDKFSRLQELISRELSGGDGPAVKDESITDTAKDLAVYALHFIALREEAMRNTSVPPLETVVPLESYSHGKQLHVSPSGIGPPPVRHTH